jgi:DNA-binding LacI/PurR family transcriptional regulator
MVNDSKELKYMEVAGYIKRHIQDGSYRVGEVIPSQRTIAESLSVNRASIKRAIDLLERGGVLECIPSVGTIVKQSPTEKTLVGYLVRSFKDPFHLEMIREMDKLLSVRNAGLIVAEGESAVRLMKMGATKIVKGGQLERTSNEDTIFTVYIGSEGIANNSIAIDSVKGMRLIYKHLQELGHTRIAFISTAIENLAGDPDMRFSLLVEAAETVQEKEYIKRHSFFIQSYSEQECSGVVESIKALSPRPTALVCSSDWLAIEIMQLALKRNLMVPEDVSITGFDNIYMSGLLNIPLTTVSFPVFEAANKAVEMLFGKADGKPQHVICEPELIQRKSTGRACPEG